MKASEFVKANEFVRNYGWDDASFYLSTAFDDAIWISFDMPEHGVDNIILKVAELKRLVKSHELVESYGGLEDAKKELQRQSILRWVNPETERLRAAIADVESCQ